MSDSFNVVIVGGGIVGLATAMTLVEKYHVRKVLLVEKEKKLASHQSGRNSGVIHSGIYYKPGSLKANFCVEGAKLMSEFAEQNQIPIEKCGKLIVASNQEQKAQLKILWERGISNQIPNLRLLDANQIQSIEPNAVGIGAIHSPNTAIIDYSEVSKVMASHFEDAGGVIQKNCEVFGFEKKSTSLTLKTSQGQIATEFLINCAGLGSDRVAKQMGCKPDVAIIPFRGEYFMVRDQSKYLVKNLVYPVPDPSFPFLGVHFTKTIYGALEVGPNAVLALAREGYKGECSGKDSLEMISSRNFWLMISRYWKTGLGELLRAGDKRVFTRQLQKLVPSLRQEDLVPGPCGIRAQCVDARGFLVDDFKIIQNAHSIHVLNAPSPAATASLKIAEHIAEMFLKNA